MYLPLDILGVAGMTERGLAARLKAQQGWHSLRWKNSGLYNTLLWYLKWGGVYYKGV